MEVERFWLCNDQEMQHKMGNGSQASHSSHHQGYSSTPKRYTYFLTYKDGDVFEFCVIWLIFTLFFFSPLSSSSSNTHPTATATNSSSSSSSSSSTSSVEATNLSNLTEIADDRLYKIVKWCKNLPVFKNISVSFQIVILKKYSSMISFIASLTLFNLYFNIFLGF